MTDNATCELCGEPMPRGEEMFRYHGYSGPCPKKVPPTGTDLIAAERIRQMDAEGWTPAHDDVYDKGELLEAAICYARIRAVSENVQAGVSPPWPWDASWWKPSADPIRNLVKAGAMIAAEIDRLTRLKEKAASGLKEQHEGQIAALEKKGGAT